MKRILSGMQPSNALHLGNYLGALKHWVTLQNDPASENLFCVVDMHAITVDYSPEVLRQNVYEITAAYLAAGLDPEKVHIFRQSKIQGHADLAWMLGCITPLGWLNRMTQFKEKAGKKKENASLGLYSYPVLQAADILIYHATHVPVGEDQKQHIELCRDIALAFNHRFGDALTIPEPVIMEEGKRIKSLRDGNNKMSKSDPSDFTRINLEDSADEIALKIKKAKTDPEPLPDSLEGFESRPEAKNLITIYSVLKEESFETSMQDWAGKNFSEFKPVLSELVVESIAPIGKRLKEFKQDKAYLDTILQKSEAHAQKIADASMIKIRELIGF